ncbi:MAG: hypothetical protein MUF81_11120 [Verrucomicrobia bacterium]|nr:hypothetical protein [Verrucomicrobiota bacterium]
MLRDGFSAAAPPAAPLHAAERKPNFLFIYTDDQRWDAMGVVQREQGERARFPWFKAPNMDRLAADLCELKNLAADPAATAKLSAEFDAQVKAVNYAVPANADKLGPPTPKANK